MKRFITAMQVEKQTEASQHSAQFDQTWIGQNNKDLAVQWKLLGLWVFM